MKEIIKKSRVLGKLEVFWGKLEESSEKFKGILQK